MAKRRHNFRTISWRKALLCNLIVVVLSLAAIIGYFVQPLWKVRIDLHVSASVIDGVIDELKDEEELDEEMEVLLDELKKEVQSKDLKLTFAVSIKTSDVLVSLAKGGKETLIRLANTNAELLLDENLDSMNEFLFDVAGVFMKIVFKQSLIEMCPDAAVRAELGITDEYLDAKLEKLTDVMYASDANVETISQTYIDIMTDINDKFRASNDPETQALAATDEDLAEMKTEISSMLSDFAADDGSIDMNELMSQIYWRILHEEFPEEFPNDGSVTDLKAHLKARFLPKLKEAINEATDEDFSTFTKVCKIVSYVLLFTFFTWAYLIVKILFKLGSKNNAIKLKLPIWLGGLPCWVLVILPSLAFGIIDKIFSLVGQSIPGEALLILKTVSAEFISGAMISFYVGIALCLFSIFYYGRLRRKLKRIAKGKERDDDYYDPYEDDYYDDDRYYNDRY